MPGEGHCLDFKDFDLQDGDTPHEAGIWFDLTAGLWEPPEFRGADLVIPQKHGRVPMDRYHDRRIVELRGHVRGLGDTLEERQESFRASMDALMVAMAFVADPGQLMVHEPYLGLASSRVLTCRPFDAIGGPTLAGMSFQRWTFRLDSVDDPPDWTSESG